jgi:cyanophycinase
MPLFLLAISLLGGIEPGADHSPRGVLVLDGGGKSLPSIRQRALELAGGKSARILIVPQAGPPPQPAELDYLSAIWRDLGATRIEALELADLAEARARIRRANLIWLTGGNQIQLVESLRAAHLDHELRERHQAGAVIGGASAGAAAVSSVMIAGYAGPQGSPMGKEPRLMRGLGLWPDAIVDQHFRERNRQPRLEKAVQAHPSLIGVGIDECTAVVVTGRRFEVIGNGAVTVIDHRPQPGDEHQHPGAAAGDQPATMRFTPPPPPRRRELRAPDVFDLDQSGNQPVTCFHVSPVQRRVLAALSEPPTVP